jgi:hypothetical protein
LRRQGEKEMAMTVKQIRGAADLQKLVDYTQALQKQAKSSKGFDPELIREWNACAGDVGKLLNGQPVPTAKM